MCFNSVLKDNMVIVMGINALLYKSYNRRKRILNIFTAFCHIPNIIFIIGFIVDEVAVYSDMASWIDAAENNLTFLLVLIIYTMLFPVGVCGLLKYMLKKNKPKIDYMRICIEGLSIEQQDIISAEVGYYLQESDSIVSFGESCLYCKYATNKWNQFRYPVIMPYLNIKQVMLHKSFEKDFNKELTAAVFIASAALAVTGLISAAGITLIDLSVPSTFIIMDYDENLHYIPCGENSLQTYEDIVYYVEQITERARHVRIGYITES